MIDELHRLNQRAKHARTAKAKKRAARAAVDPDFARRSAAIREGIVVTAQMTDAEYAEHRRVAGKKHKNASAEISLVSCPVCAGPLQIRSVICRACSRHKDRAQLVGDDFSLIVWAANRARWGMRVDGRRSKAKARNARTSS